MVNLEVYKAYSDQHQQKIMHSAQQSRNLNQMKMNQHNQSKNSSGLVYRLLKRLSQSSSSLSEDTGSIIDPNSSFVSE